MSLGKKIKNAAIRFFFGRVVNRVEKKIEESQNAELNKAVVASLALSEDYISILTDADPNNKEQVRAFLKSNALQHIEAAKAILELGISQIGNDQLQEDAKAFLQLLEELAKQEVL